MGGAESRYWDDVGERFAGGSRQRLWRLHSDAVNRALLARWLPDGPVRRLLKTDVFDEAVSEGLAGWIATRAARVHGIDISPATARAARRNSGMLVAAADCRRLPFGSGVFDAVVSISTLDHFHAPSDVHVALRELRRVLRTGGTLVLTLDNPANPFVALRAALPEPWLQRVGLVPYHVGPSLGPGALPAAARAAGFRVDEVTSTLHVPRVLAIPLARLVDRLGRPRLRHALLRALMAFEGLRRWPTRFRSGHFVALRAIAA